MNGNKLAPPFSIIFFIIIILICFPGCNGIAKANQDYIVQNIKTITANVSNLNDPNAPPGWSTLKNQSPDKSQPIPGEWSFYDNTGNARAYFTDSIYFNSHYQEIKATVERLKAGNLIIDDFKRLSSGMTQDKVRLILGKETKMISTNPLQLEYDLADGTSFNLYFKSTSNNQTLDSAYFSDKSGNTSAFSLASK